ncbi:MAG TPA: non-canonical purine NTP pyrophosphatase [Candidatus Saccharimonadales bacterium]|nr:non-canonical purine NTP pyrophosphatase [Candidatus Saccharimonadales bacterium]
MLTINFVTTNSHKFAVAQNFFKKANLLGIITLRQYSLETLEIQANSVQEVAQNSAKWVGAQLGQPVVVADAGLAIKALNGFPGPYMKYMNDTLTITDVIAMLENKESRVADFIDALAYYDPATGTSRVFTSITPGNIATSPARKEGSVVDRLFVPDGWDVPLADLTDDDRTSVWNTSRWQQLTEFLQEESQK